MGKGSETCPNQGQLVTINLASRTFTNTPTVVSSIFSAVLWDDTHRVLVSAGLSNCSSNFSIFALDPYQPDEPSAARSFPFTPKSWNLLSVDPHSELLIYTSFGNVYGQSYVDGSVTLFSNSFWHHFPTAVVPIAPLQQVGVWTNQTAISIVSLDLRRNVTSIMFSSPIDDPFLSPSPLFLQYDASGSTLYVLGFVLIAPAPSQQSKGVMFACSLPAQTCKSVMEFPQWNYTASWTGNGAHVVDFVLQS